MTGDKTATSAEALPLYFVQWLRVFLISLVVAHHAGQPYGPTGGEWPVDDPVSSPWLGPFFALNAAFFMGFFFLLSGILPAVLSIARVEPDLFAVAFFGWAYHLHSSLSSCSD